MLLNASHCKYSMYLVCAFFFYSVVVHRVHYRCDADEQHMASFLIFRAPDAVCCKCYLSRALRRNGVGCESENIELYLRGINFMIFQQF